MKNLNTTDEMNESLLDDEMNESLREPLQVKKRYSDYTMSIIYAIFAGLAFAISNSITAVLTQKYGPTGVYANCLGGLTAWALFHLLNRCFQIEPEAGIKFYLRPKQEIE